MTHDVERVLADVDADHGESLRCVSETWRAPCLERPLPASRAGRAGARPDHSISGRHTPALASQAAVNCSAGGRWGMVMSHVACSEVGLELHFMIGATTFCTRRKFP